MNIILLLQLALSLLANPQVQSNPVFKAQAVSFADTAIALAEESTALQAQNISSSSIGIGTNENPDYIAPVSGLGTSTSTTNGTPIVYTNNIDQNPPSCSITVSINRNDYSANYLQDTATVSWTLFRIPSDTIGAAVTVPDNFFTDFKNQSLSLPPQSNWGNNVTKFDSRGLATSTEFDANFNGIVCSTTSELSQ